MKAANYGALLLSIFIARSTFSQSTFGFFNYVPSVGLDAPVFDSDGNRLFGTDYLAILYGGPTPGSLEPAMVGNGPMAPHPFTRIVNNEAGYFGQGGFVSIDNVECGAFAWLQVRAWDARLGATYDDVAALGLGGYGESALFYTYGGEGCSATGRNSQPLRGLESFSLRPIPEPSTWVMLALGGGLLFLRCRRKR